MTGEVTPAWQDAEVDKISAAVLDVTEPLITALPENAPAEARRDAMRIGVLLWNALALLRRGDESAWRALAEYFRSLPEPESSTMGVLVAEAVRRKNERHADDVRIVRRWKLKLRGNGSASLWAEASAPRA